MRNVDSACWVLHPGPSVCLDIWTILTVIRDQDSPQLHTGRQPRDPTCITTTPLSPGDLQNLYREAGLCSTIFPEHLPWRVPTHVEAERRRRQRFCYILVRSGSSEFAYASPMLKRRPTPGLIREGGATRIFQLLQKET